MKISYAVDLTKVMFDEISESENYQSWIQAMPLGTYQHERYGKIEITDDRVARFADNVNKNVRETELDIDYDHKEYSGEAAGWVKQARAEPGNGLWILVEWTKKAYEAIKSKAYRYFSPEFNDEWSHPRTGEKYKDVLFGGGITNRPFLKGIVPLNLSEIQLEDKTMTPEQIREMAAKLGLGEDATPEMVYGAFIASTGLTQAAPNPPAEPEGGESSEASENAQMSENPVVKRLTEQLEKQTKVLKEITVNSQIKTLSEVAKQKNIVLSAASEAGIKKLLSDSPTDEYSDTVIKTLSEFLEKGFGPEAGENGGSQPKTDPAVADDVKKFDDKVKAKMLSDKLNYADAAVIVAAEDATEYQAYREASYLTEEG